MPLPDYLPKTKGELYQLHAVMFLGAPDDFFQLSMATPDEYVTLDSVVGELRRGIDFVYRHAKHAETRKKLHALLDASYEHYREGRVHEGRMACIEFEKGLNEARL